MLADFIWKGVIIGLSVSIPLGPIGVLTIQRTLSKGRRSGLVNGLGAATADVFYAVLAGFGISIVIDFILKYQSIFKFIGGAFLLILGYRLIVSNPAKTLRQQCKDKNKGLWGDYFSTLGLTISNPIVLFVFLAVFAGLGLIDKTSHIPSVIFLLLGVVCGACLWWFTLTFLVSIFRSKFRLRRLLIINQISGILVILFGLFVFASIFIPGLQS